MASTADMLPDDPGTLKAMLLAERARAARLEQIIKELQRHRFGRRAETLPEDQLLLGLEEVEQPQSQRVDQPAHGGGAEQHILCRIELRERVRLVGHMVQYNRRKDSAKEFLRLLPLKNPLEGGPRRDTRHIRRSPL